MARGALSNELLESDQHSEICSDSLIFSWFLINCTLYMWYAEEVGGVQLTTNHKVSPAQRNFLQTPIFFLVRN